MIKEIVDNWLAGIERDLILNYDRLGLRSSGNWAESLEQFTDLSGNYLKIGIKGSDYTYYLENGRGPNTNSDPEALRVWVGWAGSTFLKDWAESKGIDASPYAVAWKIAREGWRVPNQHNTGGLVSDVVTKGKMIDLARDITEGIIKEFKSGVIKTLR